MKEKKRVATGDAPFQWNSPFAALKQVTLPPAAASPAPAGRMDETPRPPNKHRGRVDIMRQTAHRGGKTVTVITNFVGIGHAEKERLAKKMQKACGAGGTVKEGRIEIQGDQREIVARILAEAGFQPILAGG